MQRWILVIMAAGVGIMPWNFLRAMLHRCVMAVGFSSCDGMFPFEDSNIVALALPNRKLYCSIESVITLTPHSVGRYY